MKILVSAVACNPYLGSESAVGWSVISTLAREHEVWVLLSETNRPSFDQWEREHGLPSQIHLCYVGTPSTWHPNRLIARIQSWLRGYKWQRQTLEPARKLHQEVHFDLVHHVTYATWRIASPLWQLGIPLVWGPIGGGEQFPWRLSRILSPVAFAFEIVRSVSNFISRHNRAVRQSARNAAVCVTGNQDTFRELTSLRGTTQGIRILCGNFFPQEKSENLRQRLESKPTGGPLRLFAGGNLEGRKGVHLALQALAKVKQRHVPFSYRLGGSGPELKHLQKVSQSLSLSENVTFGESLRGEAYQDALIHTHLFLLPSLREYGGITLMEAMLAGCVPIVANCGGPGEIVTDECGFRISISTPEQMAEEIAQIILRVNEDRSILEKMGKAAHDRIAQHYTSDRYLRAINEIYAEALGNS